MANAQVDAVVKRRLRIRCLTGVLVREMIETIQVEVAYATPEKKLILSVEVRRGRQPEAVEMSGIVELH